MNAPIRNAAAIFALVRERLLIAYPDLDADDQAILDTTSGECDFDEIAERLFESAERDKMMAAAIGERIGEMAERKARFLARVETKRGLLAQALQDAGLERRELPGVTLSLRRNPASLMVTDESLIPADYRTEKVVVSLDKALIKAALIDGFDVPGASLSNGSVSLTARTK